MNRLFFTVLLFSISILNAQNKDVNIVLGRPTDTSITISPMTNVNSTINIQYGLSSANLTNQTSSIYLIAGEPKHLHVGGLSSSTQYFYKINYKLGAATTWSSTPTYKFRTQRKSGEAFSFTIEADEHLYDKKGVKSIYEICLKNQSLDNPDFMFSLGDIFGDDHYPNTITSAELKQLHLDYRPFLGEICHSVPFYICLGNHEGEMDYYMLKNPGNNLAVNGTLWRKYYFANPYPNGFYTGNTNQEPYGVNYPENYYSFNWGDALFVVLDAYRDQCDTSAKPKNWEWTLGKPQYDWLKQTLESSTAKYKFVFCHHVRGQGRGGVIMAKGNEWGGYEQNGITYNFDKYRPGWGKPIHQLFVDNGVNIFFQGHDHVFAHEVLDGVVYQALPMAADSTYEIGKLANADAYTSDTLDGTGHLTVSVSTECVKVDYVKAYLPQDTVSGQHKNREIGFSYSLGNCPASNFKSLHSNQFTVFPNPAQNTVTFLSKIKLENPKIEILDLMGRSLGMHTETTIDILDIPNGVYIAKIMSGENQVSVRFIVQH